MTSSEGAGMGAEGCVAVGRGYRVAFAVSEGQVSKVVRGVSCRELGLVWAA